MSEITPVKSQEEAYEKYQAGELLICPFGEWREPHSWVEAVVQMGVDAKTADLTRVGYVKEVS